MLFEDDAIILAGATGRVGSATLRILHENGARIAVVSRKAEAAQKLCAGYERATPFVADLADAASTEKLVAEVARQFGRIDAIVNMAGSGKFVPIVDSTLEDLRLNLDGYVVTAYNLAVAGLRSP